MRVVLPTGCPRSVGFLAGFAGQKVKIPAIPGGWGGLVTNDWCITLEKALSFNLAGCSHHMISYCVEFIMWHHWHGLRCLVLKIVVFLCGKHVIFSTPNTHLN